MKVEIKKYCAFCNKEFVVCSSGIGRKYCSSSCSHEGARGKKRPKHSEHMKKLAKSGESPKFSATLMQKGKLFNKNVNTDEFKKKVLNNKNIHFEDETLHAVYNKYQNEKRNNVNAYRKKIITALAKYPGNTFTSFLLDASKWSDEELLSRYKGEIHGIFTALHFGKIGRRKIEIECSKGKIDVRSSYEKNWISFFDEKQISWNYEPRWFRLNSGRVYCPDFFINYKGKDYWIEVKGAFWSNQKEDDYMENVMKPFSQLISPIPLILTFLSKPTLETFEKELTTPLCLK